MEVMVEYFRIFGCLTLAYIPNQKRKKLEYTSKICAFAGDNDGSKAWGLYHPVLQTFIISKDCGV